MKCLLVQRAASKTGLNALDHGLTLPRLQLAVCARMLTRTCNAVAIDLELASIGDICMMVSNQIAGIAEFIAAKKPLPHFLFKLDFNLTQLPGADRFCVSHSAKCLSPSCPITSTS